VGALCLTLGLLVLAAGCTKRRKDAEYSEVSGRVLYKNQPLPGGRVTFITTDGFTGATNIDEKGNYKINAPVGPVKIAVDNAMLLRGGGVGRRGGGPPAKMPGLKRPDSEQAHAPTGRHVNIPDKYADPDASGLTYTVVAGAQTFDIKLD
jgi:hypothetical protein